MTVFAERLKKLRDTEGQTQDQLGKAVGLSRESVSKYETGTREPDVEAIASIARHFKVSADYILGITDEFTALTQACVNTICIGILQYEAYLGDKEFVPYFIFSVKMKDNSVEIWAVERYINRMLTRRKIKTF